MRIFGVVFLVVFGLIGSAQAAQHLSKQDQQILAQLSPAAQKEVRSRLIPGETVKEVVETMALNRLSMLYAEGRVVDVDVLQGVAVVQEKDGMTKKVPFTLEEVVVRE